MAEERIGGDRPFSGRLVSVRVDKVRMPNGRETVREVVEHPGAVGILPVMEDGRLILVRQYRYAVGRALLETPAGTREPGESAEECARRELEEEVGMRAGRLELMTQFYVSPGWCTEELFIYRASELEESAGNLEDDEDLEVVLVTPQEIPQLIAERRIADAKTITALSLHLMSL